MRTAKVAARLTEALEAAARAETGAPAPLVSVTVTFAQAGDIASVTTEIARKTRTILFLHSEARSSTGGLIARAESVHKLED